MTAAESLLPSTLHCASSASQTVEGGGVGGVGGVGVRWSVVIEHGHSHDFSAKSLFKSSDR